MNAAQKNHYLMSNSMECLADFVKNYYLLLPIVGKFWYYLQIDRALCTKVVLTLLNYLPKWQLQSHCSRCKNVNVL